MLIIPAGGSALPASVETVNNKLHTIQMNGQEVFRFATTIVAEATERVLKKASLKPQDVDLIIPHQANLRILTSAAKRLNIPLERFVVNLQKYGNTSAASVPIALCDAVTSGRIKPGQNIVLVGFGAGLTWASVGGQMDDTRPRKRSRRHTVYGGVGCFIAGPPCVAGHDRSFGTPWWYSFAG